VLLLLLTSSPAWAVDLDEAAILEPDVLAERLGIVGTAEAVVLVVADQDLDRLVLGLREVVLAPLGDQERFLRLVRGQVDGILSVRVERQDLLWEGDLRTLAGHVTVFDASAALASPEARGLARDLALRGFDLFGFFAELDALPTTAERQAHCDAVRESLPSGPDRGVVVQACANVATMSGPAAVARVADTDVDEDDEQDALAAAPPVAVLPSADRDPVLYRKDGLTRKIPRGTIPRLAVAAGGAILAAGLTARAFELEILAEEQYKLYRDAERVGDDLVVSQTLFDTQKFDSHRDAAIATASVGLSTTLTMLIWQAVEGRSWQNAKNTPAVAIGAMPLRGGMGLTFTLELDR
jgi:hypothetical protein